jgi:hypothetical protein
MKQCLRCLELKPADCFHKHSSNQDGLQKNCKACRKQIDSERYSRHKKKILDQQKQALIHKREFVLNYLKQHPCVDCGEANPIVLEFDHVRGEKVNSISKLSSLPGPLDKLKTEIQKCVVRCANCHRIKTAIERNYWIAQLTRG